MKENNEIVRGHINKVPKFWMQTQSIDWILQSVKGVNNGRLGTSNINCQINLTSNNPDCHDMPQ
jgi:hypothetical protein